MNKPLTTIISDITVGSIMGSAVIIGLIMGGTGMGGTSTITSTQQGVTG
ncbi:hypothetical protein [Aliikangiella marina]|nr:hypothetical protein [Aliikangiella marina]